MPPGTVQLFDPKGTLCLCIQIAQPLEAVAAEAAVDGFGVGPGIVNGFAAPGAGFGFHRQVITPNVSTIRRVGE